MGPQDTCAAPMTTPREVAHHLKVSERSVQRLAETGRIPHYRVGGQMRFDLDEVLEALRVEVTA